MQHLKFPEIWENNSCNLELFPAQLVKHMRFVYHVQTVHQNFSVLHGSSFHLLVNSHFTKWHLEEVTCFWDTFKKKTLWGSAKLSDPIYIALLSKSYWVFLGAIVVSTIAFSAYTLQGTVPQDPIPPALTVTDCTSHFDLLCAELPVIAAALSASLLESICISVSYTGISVKVEIITAANVLGTKDTHPY